MVDYDGFRFTEIIFCMKYVFLLFVFLILSCSQREEIKLHEDSWYHSLHGMQKEYFRAEYTGLRKRMEKFRKPLVKKMNGSEKKKWIDRSREYLYTTLSDSLFQFWYGTPWDFNGITEIPGEGNIACGYFVTTTLLHAGFELDRVRLAQQAASIIINSLCRKKDVFIFTNGRRDKLKEHLLRQKNSIFILGLDSHVGFLQKQDTSIFMIHSSGFYPWKVVRESFHEAQAITHSNYFMVGDLLANDDLLLKWIRNEKIEMATN